jgi:chaperone required for assembly of F1-ATPase
VLNILLSNILYAPYLIILKYLIQLDGRTLRTPGRNPLYLPNFLLASAVAAEWDAQTDAIKGIEPVTMPLMSLVSTAIDQIKGNPQETIDTCIRYLPTDAALFFTTDSDRILLMKQKQHLQPVVRWLSRLLKIDLQTTTSMARRIAHPDDVVKKLIRVMSQMVIYVFCCV